MSLQEFIIDVIPPIKVRFPDFLIKGPEAPDESASLEWVSPHGKLTLRLYLQGENLTIGFAAANSKLGWHIHMDQFDAVTLSEQVHVTVGYIGDIFRSKRPIFYSSRLGFFLTEDVESVYEYKQEAEIVKHFFWNDL